MDDSLSQEEKQSFIPSNMSRNNSKWFVQDPCGIACAVCTYIFLIYAEIVVLLVLLPAFPTLSMAPVIIIFTVLMVLSIVSHVKAMLTNPGTVAYEAVTEEEVMARRQDGEEIRYCKKCRSVKPDRAHHCSTCERCIHRMDHHCPWVNNCVGQNNQKYFVQFTLYVMATSVMGLFMSGLFFFLCVKKNFEGCDALLPGPLIFILMIFGVFEGFLFSLFTCIMFCTQVHSIITDETSIESLKKENRKRRRWMDSLIEVFGSSPGLSWLSPFSPPPYSQHQSSMRLLVSV